MQLRERLYRRLLPDPDTGCLLWDGPLNSKGYAQISVRNRLQLIHRVAWELENGPIPEGLTIDHVWDRGCRYKHCANVAHLEPVTIAVNIARSYARKTPKDPERARRRREQRARAKALAAT